MNRRSTLALLAAGLVLSAPAVAACGVGKGAGTAEVRSGITATNYHVSDTLAILNAYVLADSDTSARLLLAVANTGSSRDELTSVSTPAASSVVLAGSGLVNPLASASPTPPAPDGTLAIPAGQIITLRPGVTAYLLTLVRPLAPGNFVEVTATFQDAGKAIFRVPVENPVNRGPSVPGPTAPAATPAA